MPRARVGSFLSRLRGLRRPCVPSDGLTVLTYHRIGDRSGAAYDPWVYSADENMLDEHLRYIKSHRRVVGLEEALEIVAGRIRTPGAATLITFDDGYLDNYRTAFPLLRAHGAPAVFFLVSSFADGSTIPWWDRIAGIVNTARVQRFQLADSPVFDLNTAGRPAVIKQVLDHCKSRPSRSTAEVIGELSDVCRSSAPSVTTRQFLSWGEAREMRDGGMAIGGHTHSHAILAGLDHARQREEVGRTVMEANLSGPVDVLAYPVGTPETFSEATQSIVRDCGYRAAFSCHGGFNPPGASLFDIKRTAVWWGAPARELFD